jgi:hypothetical protein
MLKSRFDHYAILQKWDYQNPSACAFETERLQVQARDIPKTVEETLLKNHFDFDEFKQTINQGAKNVSSIKNIINELIEPPPQSSGSDIPYLEEKKICDLIFRIAAKGEITINVKGMWIGRRPEHADEDGALRYIQNHAYKSLNEMKDYQLALPDVAGHSPIAQPAASDGAVTIQAVGDGLFVGSGGIPFSEDITPNTAQPIPVTLPYPQNSPTPPAPTVPKRESDAPNTSINLIGMFEQWKLPSEKTINKASIEFSGLTVQQIKQILQRIPSSVHAGMNIDYDADIDVNGMGDQS